MANLSDYVDSGSGAGKLSGYVSSGGSLLSRQEKYVSLSQSDTSSNIKPLDLLNHNMVRLTTQYSGSTAVRHCKLNGVYPVGKIMEFRVNAGYTDIRLRFDAINKFHGLQYYSKTFTDNGSDDRLWTIEFVGGTQGWVYL